MDDPVIPFERITLTEDQMRELQEGIEYQKAYRKTLSYAFDQISEEFRNLGRAILEAWRPVFVWISRKLKR